MRVLLGTDGSAERARGWPQRGEHDGLHHPRRAGDGHALRGDRSTSSDED
jgi:hypothetical protein